MNRTLVSPDVVASPPLQRTQFFIALTLPEAPTLLEIEVAFQVTSPTFLSTNDALRVFKATEKVNEAHLYLTRHLGKSPVTTNTVLYRVDLTWKQQRRWR